MAVFPSFKLTKKGEELLNRSIGEGKVLTFTKFEIGDGNPPSDFREQTSLVNKFYQFPVLSTDIQKNQILRIKGYFDNKSFTGDKQLKEIGVFVKIENDETEYLYSYTNAGESGDIIPGNTRGFYSRTLDVANYIGYATNITFNIEQLRDRYAFNSENEMKVASYLKAGDKVELWGNLVLGDKPVDEYIVQSTGGVKLSNGLYAKKINRQYVAETIEQLKTMQLKENDVVEVLGYYTKGDGAHHKRIVSSLDNGNGVQLANGKYANIVHNGEVNVIWFGAKGDGINDDTEIIQNIMNHYNNIVFKDKVFLINPVFQDGKTGLKTKNNQNLNFINSKLVASSTDKDRYAVLLVTGKNLVINNPVIVGDRDIHITTPTAEPDKNIDGFRGEWGYGIRVESADNVIINNPHVTKCWGDSYIITESSNVKILNPYAAYSRRQGITVGSCNNLVIDNPYIENISGTMPQSAIDVEPDREEQRVKNLVINNLYANECAGEGLLIYLVNHKDDTEYNISVNGLKTKNTKGFKYEGSDTGKVNLYLNDINTSDCWIANFCKNSNVYIDRISLDTSIQISGYKNPDLNFTLEDTTNIVINEIFYKKNLPTLVMNTVWNMGINLKKSSIKINRIINHNQEAVISNYNNLLLDIKYVESNFLENNNNVFLKDIRHKKVTFRLNSSLTLDRGNKSCRLTETLLEFKSGGAINNFGGTTINGKTENYTVPENSLLKLITNNNTDFIVQKIY